MNHAPATLIRVALPTDASAIEGLYRQLVSNPAVNVQPDRIAQLAHDPNTQVLVAAVGGEVRGTALLTFCQDIMFNAQPFGLIENIVVAEGSRGIGIGGALLKRIDELAVERQCSKIMLLSSSARDVAHQFFERAGYNGTAKRGFVKYARSIVCRTVSGA